VNTDPAGVVARLDRLPLRGPILLLLVVGSTSFFFDTADSVALGLVAPTVRSVFGIELSTVAVIVALSYLALFVGAYGGGWLADRWGRRPTLVLATVWSGLGGASAALSGDVVSFTALRCLGAVGIGALYVVTMVYLVEMSPHRHRGRIIAFAFTVSGVGVIAVTGFARWAVPLGAEGWRLIFCAALLGLATIPFLLRLPESPRWLLAQGRTKQAGTAIEWLERRFERRGTTLDEPVPTTEPPVVEEVRTRELFGRRLRRPTLLGMLVIASFTVISQLLTTWTPTLLDAKGFSTSDALSIASLVVLGSLVGGGLATLLARRASPKTTAVVCCLLGATVGMGFGFAAGFWVVVVFGFVHWICLGVIAPVGNRIIAEQFPSQARGRGTGMALSAGRLANVVAPFALALALASLGVTSVAWLFLAAWLLITAGVIGLVHRRRARVATSDSAAPAHDAPGGTTRAKTAWGRPSGRTDAGSPEPESGVADLA
jgi:putative MFS transporter